MLVLMAHFELTLDMPQQGVDHLVIAYKWYALAAWGVHKKQDKID